MKKICMVILLVVSIFINCSHLKNEVVIKKTEHGYELHRNGKPFYIKGAGGNSDLKILSEFGGNSIRTWGVDQWEKTFKPKKTVEKSSKNIRKRKNLLGILEDDFKSYIKKWVLNNLELYAHDNVECTLIRIQYRRVFNAILVCPVAVLYAAKQPAFI